MPKKKGGEISEWRRVIDACPDRAGHLLDEVRARLADGKDCRVRDDWDVGMGSILRCLAHTFGLSADDVDELAGDALLERDHPDILHQPPYRGGHPRIPEDADEVGFYATRDLEELVWSRGSELFTGDSYASLATARLANGGAEWSLSMWSERFGDTGLWKTSYSLDGDFDEDFVIGLWSPYEDRVSRAASVEDALRSWWGRFLYEREGADSWTLDLLDPDLLDPASFSALLARWCMDRDRNETWRLVTRSAHERAEQLASIPVARWQALIDSPSPSDWWSDPSLESADARRDDERFVRELAGFFVATSLELEGWE